MAATAGSMVFVGSTRTYNIDLYVPDAVSGLVTFSPSGLSGTGSPSTWRAPENGYITELSVAAAPTAVGCILSRNGATINGGAVRYANILATLATRVKIGIPINAGDFIGATNY
jgi:hypothetical protein